ncbi:MAG: hypothetical protein ABSB42_05145 [Tepidisphaeraceae bacterium]|jgi:hypothetical protein
MLPPYLPPEKSAVTNDAAELRSFLERAFAVSYVRASLSELNLLPAATIDVRGQTFPCTQKFLEDLASFIRMPAIYAYEIEFDLFQHNFRERKRVKDQAVQVCVLDGRAVGLAPGEYRPARTLDVLDALPSVEEGFWKIQKSLLSDRTVEIDLLSEDVVVEPRPGDVIRGGIRISNSETGGCGLKASLYTHRLLCSNGAVMSDSLGTVRWSYDRRVTYVSSIAKFSNDLVNLRNRQSGLKSVYSSAVERRLKEEDVTRLWRRIRSTGKFTPEDTNRILGITDDERRRLASAVAGRQAANQPAEESAWDVFTIHNRITAAAKSFPFGTRSRLERIGGNMLSSYSAN